MWFDSFTAEVFSNSSAPNPECPQIQGGYINYPDTFFMKHYSADGNVSLNRAGPDAWPHLMYGNGNGEASVNPSEREHGMPADFLTPLVEVKGMFDSKGCFDLYSRAVRPPPPTLPPPGPPVSYPAPGGAHAGDGDPTRWERDPVAADGTKAKRDPDVADCQQGDRPADARGVWHQRRSVRQGRPCRQGDAPERQGQARGHSRAPRPSRAPAGRPRRVTMDLLSCRRACRRSRREAPAADATARSAEKNALPGSPAALLHIQGQVRDARAQHTRSSAGSGCDPRRACK